MITHDYQQSPPFTCPPRANYRQITDDPVALCAVVARYARHPPFINQGAPPGSAGDITLSTFSTRCDQGRDGYTGVCYAADSCSSLVQTLWGRVIGDELGGGEGRGEGGGAAAKGEEW